VSVALPYKFWDALYLLLLHQLGVGAVIHHVRSKNRGGERAVNLLGVDMAQFPVENEVVASSAHVHSRLLAEKYKGEDITVLSPH
jgi:hypothetical protein